jgi:hypothetical protein
MPISKAREYLQESTYASPHHKLVPGGRPSPVQETRGASLMQIIKGSSAIPKSQLPNSTKVGGLG